MIEVTIPLRSHDEAILVLGPYDRYAKLLRQALEIEIYTREGNLRLKGVEEQVGEARRRIEHLLGKSRKGRELAPADIESILLASNGNGSPAAGLSAAGPVVRENNHPAGHERLGTPAPQPAWRRSAGAFPRLPPGLKAKPVEPRNAAQRTYLETIRANPLTFGIGAAGTGKTFLAVAAAVHALRTGECKRLVITRPVVEAGERLGFLPGDLQAKLNPYMRPIYDSLQDILGFEDVVLLEEMGVIEIAPLAYMRGRTLANAFVILDEGQNTTVSQMKMFLTRMGEHSRMVVTGDPSQTDLERGVQSGLLDAVRRLRGYQGIGLTEFSLKDIVRHPLVERIVRAYELPVREEDERRTPNFPFAGDGPS